MPIAEVFFSAAHPNSPPRRCAGRLLGNNERRFLAGARSYSEVRAVGQIRHEHVVTIHDSGHTEDGRPYLAMEFLAGEDLASHLKQHGPMQSSRAMLLWRQAVSAVAAAHRRQVVHRDIKPANLFITYKEGDDGPEEIIKVIDFSIAKLINPGRELRPTEPGAIVGTVLYMAPEQLESSEATPRSDVYSLGLVLMEMLTGRLPWGGAAGDPIEVGNALLRLVAAPTSLRELEPEQPFSEELLQLARDVLSRDPSQRPADAGELLRRIKQLPEMREWQRLPRRLSWPALTSSELTPAGLTRQPAGLARPSSELAATAPEPETADRTVPEGPL
ncbi:MAG TPA: serine/threonine-protein kinase, partial [Pseudomonadota bacterium]|nr:serine/threonine-protein kinase [Pseudomonadota bacterium]